MPQEPSKDNPQEPSKENPREPSKENPREPQSIRERLTWLAKHAATRHLALTAVLVLMSILVVRLSAHWARDKGQDLFRNLRHSEVLTSSPEGNPPSDPEAGTAPAGVLELRWSDKSVASAAEKARLADQLAEVRQKARFHLRVVLFMFEHYYATVVVFSLSGAVAAIMLVLISKKGWNKANPYIITVFFVTTAATVLYRAFPDLFRTEQGLNENKLLYLKYVALEDEILSYAATGVSPPEAERKTEGEQAESGPAQDSGAGGAGNGAAAPSARFSCDDASSSDEPRCFILHVDEELAQGGIPIGLDYSKAPQWTDAFNFETGGARVPVGGGSAPTP